jgi:hypothetical protein
MRVFAAPRAFRAILCGGDGQAATQIIGNWFAGARQRPNASGSGKGTSLLSDNGQTAIAPVSAAAQRSLLDRRRRRSKRRKSTTFVAWHGSCSPFRHKDSPAFRE